jgi:hypothetical protein
MSESEGESRSSSERLKPLELEGSKERLEALRQVLRQKWETIEHYDKLDVQVMAGVITLVGAGLVSIFRPDGHAQSLPAVVGASLLAMLLSFSAYVIVCRNFTSCYRALGVICRVEIALDIQGVIQERPGNADPNNRIEQRIHEKFGRSWRIAPAILYVVVFFAVYMTVGAVSIAQLWAAHGPWALVLVAALLGVLVPLALGPRWIFRKFVLKSLVDDHNNRQRSRGPETGSGGRGGAPGSVDVSSAPPKELVAKRELDPSQGTRTNEGVAQAVRDKGDG